MRRWPCGSFRGECCSSGCSAAFRCNQSSTPSRRQTGTHFWSPVCGPTKNPSRSLFAPFFLLSEPLFVAVKNKFCRCWYAVSVFKSQTCKSWGAGNTPPQPRSLLEMFRSFWSRCLLRSQQAGYAAAYRLIGCSKMIQTDCCFAKSASDVWVSYTFNVYCGRRVAARAGLRGGYETNCPEPPVARGHPVINVICFQIKYSCAVWR